MNKLKFWIIENKIELILLIVSWITFAICTYNILNPNEMSSYETAFAFDLGFLFSAAFIIVLVIRIILKSQKLVYKNRVNLTFKKTKFLLIGANLFLILINYIYVQSTMLLFSKTSSEYLLLIMPFALFVLAIPSYFTYISINSKINHYSIKYLSTGKKRFKVATLYISAVLVISLLLKWTFGLLTKTTAMIESITFLHENVTTSLKNIDDYATTSNLFPLFVVCVATVVIIVTILIIILTIKKFKKSSKNVLLFVGVVISVLLMNVTPYIQYKYYESEVEKYNTTKLDAMNNNVYSIGYYGIVNSEYEDNYADFLNEEIKKMNLVTGDYQLYYEDHNRVILDGVKVKLNAANITKDCQEVRAISNESGRVEDLYICEVPSIRILSINYIKDLEYTAGESTNNANEIVVGENYVKTAFPNVDYSEIIGKIVSGDAEDSYSRQYKIVGILKESSDELTTYFNDFKYNKGYAIPVYLGYNNINIGRTDNYEGYGQTMMIVNKDNDNIYKQFSGEYYVSSYSGYGIDVFAAYLTPSSMYTTSNIIGVLIYSLVIGGLVIYIFITKSDKNNV